ncbi:MAG: hypothetical protein ACRDPY_16245 [Streptosporangiaceae bacterium]
MRPERAERRPVEGDGVPGTTSLIATVHTIPARGPLPHEVAGLLDLSDERDLWLRRVLAAWREGYAAAAARLDAEYEHGFTDGVLAVKRAQHGIVRDLRQHLRTWDGRRADFGKPRPGDYPGRGDAA